MSGIDTIEGLFGEKIHYKDGEKIGESWPGFFGGSWNHYDAEGNPVGSSQVGLIADQVHYNADGEAVGYSNRGLFGGMNHYDDDGFAGHTFDTMYGQFTDLDGF